MRNGIKQGERRLVMDLGYMSWDLIDKQTMHLTVLTLPTNDVQKLSRIVKVMELLFGRKAETKLSFSSMWTWDSSRDVYINIYIYFDEIIRSPEAFAFAQLGQLRWMWSFYSAIDSLKFYMQYICGYTSEEALEQAAIMISNHASSFRKYGWICLTTETAVVTDGVHELKLMAFSYGDDTEVYPLPRDYCGEVTLNISAKN